MKRGAIAACAAFCLAVGAGVAPAAVFTSHPDLELFGQKLFRDFSAAPKAVEVPVTGGYVLGPGDTLVVNVWGFVEEEHSREVETDGSIVLPRIGKLSVGGRTLRETSALIEERFLQTYKNIRVSVTTGRLRTFPVFILGEVVKPGRYEVSPRHDIIEILSMAGGPAERGSLRGIKLIRRDGPTGALDLYPFLLQGERPPQVDLAPGDTLFVPLIGAVVGVKGAVRRPGVYETSGPTALAGALELAGGLSASADPDRIQIERQDSVQGRILLDVGRSSAAAQAVRDLDIVTVFALPEVRYNQVAVEGAVKRPGGFGWKEGMRISDVLGRDSLLPDADAGTAEVVRIIAETGGRTILPFSPEKLFAGDASQNHALRPQDKIVVSSKARPEKRVLVQGEVFRPGEYVAGSGERLSSLLSRIGGFTSNADFGGVVFLRESVRIQRERQLRQFVQEKQRLLEKEESRSENPDEKELIERGKLLLKQLAESDIKGRIVLSLENHESVKGTDRDFLLEHGDILYIPKKPISVGVVGEVNQPANILHRPGQPLAAYIERVGGYSKDADRKGVFLVKRDGTATQDVKRAGIDAGDTIVVPFEAKERVGKVVRDIVQMMYQMALSVAAF